MLNIDSSKIQEKLSALRLPDLHKKSFLHLAKEDTLLCDYARFSGASLVTALVDELAFEKLSRMFSEINYLLLQIDQLKSNSYDVIFLDTLLNSLEEPEVWLHKLMESIAEDGVLVIELFIFEGRKNEWVEINDSFGLRKKVPTRKKLSSLLEPYAWKMFGKNLGVDLEGVSRRVVHVRRKKPYAFLLMEAPASGKSTLARHFFKSHKVSVLSGDGLYIKIAEGSVKAAPELVTCVQSGFQRYAIDKTIEKVFANHLHGEFLAHLLPDIVNKDIAIDTYVPKKYWPVVTKWVREHGYFPVLMSWEGHSDMISGHDSQKNIQRYYDYLLQRKHEKINIKKARKNTLDPTLYWHLDTPVHGQALTEDSAVKISGWVCFDRIEQPNFMLEISSGDQSLTFRPNKKRADVWPVIMPNMHIIKQAPLDAYVGFSVWVETSWLQSLSLKVHLENKCFDLLSINAQSSSRKRWLGR